MMMMMMKMVIEYQEGGIKEKQFPWVQVSEQRVAGSEPTARGVAVSSLGP